MGSSPGEPGLDLQLSVNAQGRLQTEEEFGEIIVKNGDNGEVVRLRERLSWFEPQLQVRPEPLEASPPRRSVTG